MNTFVSLFQNRFFCQGVVDDMLFNGFYGGVVRVSIPIIPHIEPQDSIISHNSLSFRKLDNNFIYLELHIRDDVSDDVLCDINFASTFLLTQEHIDYISMKILQFIQSIYEFDYIDAPSTENNAKSRTIDKWEKYTNFRYNWDSIFYITRMDNYPHTQRDNVQIKRYVYVGILNITNLKYMISPLLGRCNFSLIP